MQRRLDRAGEHVGRLRESRNGRGDERRKQREDAEESDPMPAHAASLPVVS